MTRFTEFALNGGVEHLEARLSLSRLATLPGSVSTKYASEPEVPDPDPDMPDDPPPPEPRPGPFPGNPPPPVFPPPPLGGPVGPA